MQPAPVPAPRVVRRWLPWAIGAAAAIAWFVAGPRGAVGEAPVWSGLARIAAAVPPFGDGIDRQLALLAVCVGAAAVVIARLVIVVGGGDVAASVGAVAAAAVVVAAGPWAHAAGAGAFAVAAVLVVAAIALAERVAAGGGAVAGVGLGIATGLAIAVDRSALALAPVVGVLLAVRLRHGARWALIVPVAGAAAWLVAMIPTWLGVYGGGPAAALARIGDERYAIDLADGVGAIAAVAATVGLLVAVRRRSTRWSGAVIAAAVVGGIALDRLVGHPAGATPIAGLAIAAGLGVARMARLAAPPIGQACIGAAAAIIVAVPAVLAAL